ncbi:hypothetical protein [Mumia zhuanghuii]|uniref:Uncharacterized protein n=1 Tax=Mumia zhuanghuii TaxID=2585211 RepID=A0A5C4MEG6_9ACTN|nr:hypothetical protein [Mumia zhuanghuii]TNC33106.1 hypothetical protein FHE65_29515 [Mumia zhuanghuii]TNC44264.1 hypothetical protein FHE65_16775 [Mumia zhuanghuii]
MSRRPGRWELLEHDSDPVPGSPELVEDEAGDYQTLASTIAAQARRLRALAEPDTALKGDYAEVLRKDMNELAADLDKIDDRFSKVAGQLRLFKPALETARTATKSALDDAVEADGTLNKEKAAEAEAAAAEPDKPPTRPDLEPTPGEQALANARTACRAALSEFEDAASTIARAIREAADDDMKDPTGWKKFFKDAWEFTVKALRHISDIAMYAGILLAFAALLIPGVNFFAVLLIAGLISLAANTILAATGNGSWSNVAFDIIGLATLGVGRIGVQIARLGRSATLARAARPAARAARTSAFQRTAWNGGRGIRGALSRFSPTVRTAMRTAHDDVINAARARPLAEYKPSFMGAARGMFDSTAAAYADDLAKLRGEFPGLIPTFRHEVGLNVMRGAAAGSWGVGGTQLTLKGMQYVDEHTQPSPSEVSLVSGGTR